MVIKTIANYQEILF